MWAPYPAVRCSRVRSAATLPPLEQWYVMLLHNGVLPGALAGKPNTAYTRSLIEDAKTSISQRRDSQCAIRGRAASVNAAVKAGN